MFFLLCTGCSVHPLYDSNLSTDSSVIDVDVIAERDGQKLRAFLLETFRDLGFTDKKYRLTVKLTRLDKPFAIASDGNAKRLQSSYIANVVLMNKKRKIILKKSISASTSSNIASAHGEVILSMYGNNNGGLLKELSHRIAESIMVILSHES